MTTALETRPLQPRFGVEILDVDIRDVTGGFNRRKPGKLGQIYLIVRIWVIPA